MKNLLVLTKYGRLGASSRMRFFQYFSYLRSHGFDINHQPLISDVVLQARYKNGKYRFLDTLSSYFSRVATLLKVHNSDLVWIQAESLPYWPVWFELWLLRKCRYVLDYDDAIFHNYDQHKYWIVRFLFSRRIDRLMKHASLVVAGNAYLAQRAIDAGCQRVEIIPTVIDLERYEVEHKDSSVPVIGWIGSPTTSRYLKQIEPALIFLSKKIDFELQVVGGIYKCNSLNVKLLPWSEEKEASLIQGFSVGVMPLTDSPFELGKCGYKLIQYMACGKPVVASPVGVNKVIVETSGAGFLVESTDDWVEALYTLLTEAKKPKAMGKAGREAVEKIYCLQVTAPKLKQLFDSLVYIRLL